jgi:hypothetical protein
MLCPGPWACGRGSPPKPVRIARGHRKVGYLLGETVESRNRARRTDRALAGWLFEMTGRVLRPIRNPPSPSLFSRVAGQATSERDSVDQSQAKRTSPGRVTSMARGVQKSTRTWIFVVQPTRAVNRCASTPCPAAAALSRPCCRCLDHRRDRSVGRLKLASPNPPSS